MKNLIYIVFLFIFFQNCDVPGIMKITNETNHEILFSLRFTDEYKYMDEPSVSISPKTTENIMFGFGTKWSDSIIKHYSNDRIASIIVEYENQQCLIYSDTAILEIMKQAEKKSVKRKLLINIDKDFLTDYCEGVIP